MSQKLPHLKIEIYLDGAEKEKMLKAHKEAIASGFTTNPSLMVKAGITDYLGFCKEILENIKDMPISFEVFADDFTEMKRQALLIAKLGKNVFVKIPIQNTKGQSAVPLIKELFALGLRLNITAIFTEEQLNELRAVMTPKDEAIVSVFAGRIADTGVDPMPLMSRSVQIFRELPTAKILWASSRETFNVYQAQSCGCHIITVTPDILSKLNMFGKTPAELSLETVKTFFQDGQRAGFKL